MELIVDELQQTVFGEIPGDWIACDFQDVLTGFSSGMTPYRGIEDYYTGDIPWITSGELNYNVIDDTEEKITKDAVTNTNLKILPVGTFLMAITGLEAEGTRGSCGITGVESTTNQSCMALHPIKGKITTEYLFHFYRCFGDMLAFKFCQGTKQQSYTGGLVKILPIVLPPTLHEQRAIATALFDVDALIASLDKLIEKKKMIRQGVMQELLIGKTRLEGFGKGAGYKQTEVGVIPSDWIVLKLGDGVKIYSGESPSKVHADKDGTPYFKVEQLNYSSKYVWESPYYIRHDNPVPKGSIVFPKRGASILQNKLRIFSQDSFIDTNLMALEVSTDLDPELLFYMLSYHGLDKLADTTSVPQINNKHIIPYRLAIPTIRAEQRAIVSVLSDMDSAINILETTNEKYRYIKQGMMQELLTGRTRLV